MSDWTLLGSGRHEHAAWPQLREFTHDWTAAWADNSGFHIEPMPDTAPNATHLWAWNTGRWLRARLDIPHWWAAILTTTPSEPLPEWQSSEIPEPRVDTALPWTDSDQRVQQFWRSTTLQIGKTIQLLPQHANSTPFIGNLESLPGTFQRLLDQKNPAPRRTYTGHPPCRHSTGTGASASAQDFAGGTARNTSPQVTA